MTEGDWEEDHEKLAEITEQSRIRHNSYNNENHIESDDPADLDLEASISQLVLEDCDDPICENGETTNPQPFVCNMLYFLTIPLLGEKISLANILLTIDIKFLTVIHF
jgi:hypothetical protein